MGRDMTASGRGLPEPDTAALAASRELQALIRARIEAAGGWIPFSSYMDAALYTPGLGYYSGGSKKLGAAGDFVTAPALGDFFARALVVSTAPALAKMQQPQVLEIGAGSGRLAEQLLELFPAAGIELERYAILEPSAELKERQRETLARFGSRVTWIDTLAGLSIEGLALANEVADALPFERFRKEAGEHRLLGVEWHESGLRAAPDPRHTFEPAAAIGLDPELIGAWPDGYTSEFRPMLGPWIGTIGDSLQRGIVLLIDYGLTRQEYYGPERSGGTLMCHYRHRAHCDPFLYPGLQDITAWVDFSACAEAACTAGLTLRAFTPQGGWLIEALAGAGLPTAALAPEAAAQLKTLVLPGEMGERFKLLALTRDVDDFSLPGRDLSSRL
jgi:SAM-dependent MidA family methyltransferase